jgi:hypothetical protein
VKAEEKLLVARAMIASVAPEVRALGWHQPAHWSRPNTWTFERDGLTLVYTENALIYGDNADAFHLIDVWPIGRPKVFSAHWSPTKPWLPPQVVACKSGEWMKLLGVAPGEPSK